MHRCNMTTVPATIPTDDAYANGWSRTIAPRPVAVCLSVLFCAGLLVVPILDGLLGAWREPAGKIFEGISKVVAAATSRGWDASGLIKANNAALEAIKDFESSLEDSSAIAAALRPSTLDKLLRFGGAGSEEAYIGEDGWVFYRPDVDAVVMHSSSTDAAATGIAEFAAQLGERGIKLVVVPVPGKATIHPEKLTADSAGLARPPAPQVLLDLGDKVSASREKISPKGLPLAPSVIDVTSKLWRRKAETGDEQFLKTDSHWTPGAMSATADHVAQEISVAGVNPAAEKLVAEKQQVSATGDTAMMLALPASSPLLATQSVVIEQIRTGDGQPWQANRKSPVLVLGDSYVNIYSAEGLGWGSGAGFAEQLSLRLGSRVDRIARNDAGAKSAREMLAAEAGKNPGWLEGKKVVVWVMAAREFVRGDWSPVGSPVDQDAIGTKRFCVASPGRPVDVDARILSLGPLPVPGRSPYADYLTAVLLGDMKEVASGRSIPGEALAYLFTMRDRKAVVEPGLAQGRRVKLRLSNYAERADKLDPLNRGDLDDFGVMMEEPNFAEWIVPQ